MNVGSASASLMRGEGDGVHEDFDTRECPECEGEYDEGKACYRCGGAGVLEYEVASLPSQYATCPKCGALMARRGKDGEVWCKRHDGFTKPYGIEEVLRNPAILER